jgi:hypothetical protein
LLKTETPPSKVRCADDDEQSNDQPVPAHQCFFLNSLARRDRLVRPTIDLIFVMSDRAAAFEHHI